MTYIGEVHNGVVVLKDAPPLEEGTEVRVEVTGSSNKFRRGSAAAVLQHKGTWVGPEGEIDRLLAEVREMKQEELRLQQSQPDEQL
jgi:hypothetical protein